MILPFIQDIEQKIQQTAELNQPGEGNIISDINKDTDQLNYSYENSFESKYLHFKEKIERDRLAWETLSGRK